MQVYKLFFSIVLLTNVHSVKGQIVRSVVGSSHTIVSTNTHHHQAATGQFYSTGLEKTSLGELRPGFIQPLTKKKTLPKNLEISAFPNPTTGKVNITIPATQVVSISCLNSFGISVPLTVGENGEYKQLDFTRLPAGAYTVYVSDGANKYNTLQIIHLR